MTLNDFNNNNQRQTTITIKQQYNINFMKKSIHGHFYLSQKNFSSVAFVCYLHLFDAVELNIFLFIAMIYIISMNNLFP